jgi:hypothetical protein
MTQNTGLTPHEILELRELLNSEVIGNKKMQASMIMVKDEELKTFMKKCLDTKKDSITAMQGFIENNLNIQASGGNG